MLIGVFDLDSMSLKPPNENVESFGASSSTGSSLLGGAFGAGVTDAKAGLPVSKLPPEPNTDPCEETDPNAFCLFDSALNAVGPSPEAAPCWLNCPNAEFEPVIGFCARANVEAAPNVGFCNCPNAEVDPNAGSED